MNTPTTYTRAHCQDLAARLHGLLQAVEIIGNDTDAIGHCKAGNALVSMHMLALEQAALLASRLDGVHTPNAEAGK